VPERFFSIEGQPQQALSTAKAILLANAAGQELHYLSPQNYTEVFPLLQLDSATESDILRALQSGKEVYTHTAPVSVGGNTGVGYVVADPLTGAAAYLISGGANGGDMIFGFGAVALGLFGLFFAVEGLFVAPILGLALLVASFAALAAGLHEFPGFPGDISLTELEVALLFILFIVGILAFLSSWPASGALITLGAGGADFLKLVAFLAATGASIGKLMDAFASLAEGD